MLLSKAFVSACTPKETFPIITWIKQKKLHLTAKCMCALHSEWVQSSVYLSVIKSGSSYDEVQVIGTAMFSLFINFLKIFLHSSKHTGFLIQV